MNGFMSLTRRVLALVVAVPGMGLLVYLGYQGNEMAIGAIIIEVGTVTAFYFTSKD